MRIQAAGKGRNTIQRLKQIKKKYEKELFAKENVVGVAIGFKYVGGKKTDELSVIIDVVKKVAKNDLAKKDLVPKKLDGVKTDVFETGLIRALYDPTQKYRPAPGGVSIGHKDITAGTLGVSILRGAYCPPVKASAFLLGFNF